MCVGGALALTGCFPGGHALVRTGAGSVQVWPCGATSEGGAGYDIPHWGIAPTGDTPRALVWASSAAVPIGATLEAAKGTLLGATVAAAMGMLLDEATAATGATGAGTCTWKASPGLRPSGTVTCIIWPFACTAIGWPPTTPSGTFTCIIVGAAGAVETTAAAIGGALSGATGDELTTVPMMTDMARGGQGIAAPRVAGRVWSAWRQSCPWTIGAGPHPPRRRACATSGRRRRTR